MKRASFKEMDCSIAQSLEVVGEWWSLLIVREVLTGRRRFDELQADLGIARNVLTDRLNRLVDEGILEKVDIGQRGTRYEYRATEAGIELVGVLRELMAWGDKWRSGERTPMTELRHQQCGSVMHQVSVCSECGEPLTPRNVTAHPGPDWVDDESHPINKAAANR